MAKKKVDQWLTKEGLTKIGGWARSGLSDEQIAKNVGVSRSTLNEWKKKYPDISDTLKKEKEVADFEVENALFRRATGFDHEEVTYVAMPLNQEEYDEKVAMHLDVWHQQNPKATQAERDLFISTISRYTEQVSKRVVRHVAPDTTAAIFWLKNRDPLNWRDKREHQVDGTLETNNKIDLSGYTPEQLLRLTEIYSDDEAE